MNWKKTKSGIFLLGDPEVTANIYCKSRNLPNTDTQNYTTDLREILSRGERKEIPGEPEVTADICCKSRNLPNTDTQNYSRDLWVTTIILAPTAHPSCCMSMQYCQFFHSN